MNKIFYLLSLATFFFVGYNAGANAQAEAVNVGNPDSANTMMIQQEYIATTPAQPMINPNAPTGDNLMDNTMPQPDNTGAAVMEDTTTTTTSGPTYEIKDYNQEEIIVPEQ